MKLDYTNPLHNLYGFARAYEKEREFLAEWITDGISLAEDGADEKNPLMQYFGNTWGRRGEDGANAADQDDLSDFSYFKVLAVVSDMLQDKCGEYLQSDGSPSQFDYPPIAIDGGGQAIARNSQQERDRCLECIRWLRDTLAGDLGGAGTVDEVAEDTANSAANRNLYLKALGRMMDIENECFQEQIAFLNKALKANGGDGQ